MGSSKQISNREICSLVFLFQQSGIFWLLPYFLVRENGTIGLLAILFGLLIAAAILWTARYWYLRMPEYGFITALQQKNRIAGNMLGSLFFAIYLLFAGLMLYSLMDVVQHQLLRETPYLVLCLITVLLVGWMSWGGLESIARMSMFGVVAVFFMFLLSIVGSADLFAVEHALPLQVKNPAQLQEAALQSAFCYSGLLVLFMIYPTSQHNPSLHRKVWTTIVLGALFGSVWTWYALCIFGEYSLQTILWIPVQLARMVQIPSVTEQTESLFIIVWMGIVLCNSALFLWCASEAVHQLAKKQKNRWLHSAVTIFLFVGIMFLQNCMLFLQILHYLAYGCVMLLPLLLLGVFWATPRRRR